MEEIVARHPYEITDDLTQAVTLPFNRITPQMLRKVSHTTWGKIIICNDNDGAPADRRTFETEFTKGV